MGIPVIWDAGVLDYDKWVDFKRPDLAPGTACWGPVVDGEVSVPPKRISYICPCGCSEWRQISVTLDPTKQHSGGWLWNGDLERPTLTPSIQHNPGSAEKCQWHGFLTAGEWVTC